MSRDDASVVGGEYLLTRALGWLANQYHPNESIALADACSHPATLYIDVMLGCDMGRLEHWNWTVCPILLQSKAEDTPLEAALPEWTAVGTSRARIMFA